MTAFYRGASYGRVDWKVDVAIQCEGIARIMTWRPIVELWKLFVVSCIIDD